jgi:hypothetical protein
MQILSVHRSERGDKVLIYGATDKGNMTVLLSASGELRRITSNEKIKQESGGSDIQIKQEKTTDGNYIVSVNGVVLHDVREHALDNAAGFIATQKSDAVELRYVLNPGNIAASINRRWYGIGLYAGPGKLYVCGRVNDGKVQHGIECFKYDHSGSSLRFAKSFLVQRPQPGSSPFYIEDIDTEHQLILIVESNDLPIEPVLFIYDIEQGTLEEISKHRNFVFCLESDMVEWFDK